MLVTANNKGNSVKDRWIKVTTNQDEIIQVKSDILLGVIVDESLNWDKQVNLSKTTNFQTLHTKENKEIFPFFSKTNIYNYYILIVWITVVYLGDLYQILTTKYSQTSEASSQTHSQTYYRTSTPSSTPDSTLTYYLNRK